MERIVAKMNRHLTFGAGQARLGGGLNVLAAIWLIISGWVLGAPGQQAYVNNVVVGLIVLVLALSRYSGMYEERWLSWVNVVLGLWVIIVPWVLHFTSAAMYWSNVIIGIVIVALAIYSSAGTVTLNARSRRPAR